jgi:hypothetical protein
MLHTDGVKLIIPIINQDFGNESTNYVNLRPTAAYQEDSWLKQRCFAGRKLYQSYKNAERHQIIRRGMERRLVDGSRDD